MILVEHDVFSDRFDHDLLLDAFLEIEDKIMFGSDFPNIPYDYSLALKSIHDLPVGEETKEKIFWKNAKKFYNLS